MTVREWLGPVLDGWVNTLTGFGTSNDRAASTVHQIAQEQQASTLEALYTENWLARRVVQLLPDQALRKPPTCDVEGALAAFDVLNAHEAYPQGVLQQALYQGRTFGGAALFVGFKYGEPLDAAPEPGPGSTVLWLDAVPWQQISVRARETDRNSPRFGLPSVLRISTDHPRGGYECHASRCVFCEGLPRARYDKSANTPWLSALQPVFETLRDYGTSWQAMSMLLQEASVGVLKMEGLIDMLGAEDQAAAKARLEMLTLGRSVAHTIFLDAEHAEDFTRTEVSFQSLPQLMQQISLRMAGAAGYPAALLFGQEPTGMNATGESDIRHHYDNVSVYQRTSIQPKLTRLLSWISGKPCALTFPSLWEASDAEKAQTRLSNATADRTWYDLGALDPLEIAVSRARDGSLGIAIDADAKQVAAQAAQNDIPEGASVEITPSTQEWITSVNEARAANKLPALPGPEGAMTIAEYKLETERRINPPPESSGTVPAP